MDAYQVHVTSDQGGLLVVSETWLPGWEVVEPLCAGYGPACREAITHSLDQGDLRAIAFHERIGVGILPLSEVARYGAPEVLFFNVNTTDDLARTDELWRRLESSPSSAGRTPERRR